MHQGCFVRPLTVWERCAPSFRERAHLSAKIKQDMKRKMTMTQRVLLAVLVLLVDLAIFFFPLTAVFLAYIILFNPLWFREFLDRIDRPEES